MRRLLLAPLLLLSVFAKGQAPNREGSYRSSDGKTLQWRIDEHHSLVWNGTRYTPVGLRVDGTPAAINDANAAGIKDVLIDLSGDSGDWKTAVDAAEANGQRYLVRVSSLAPGTSGVAVDPASYRVAGLVGPTHVDIPLPGASRALVVVALKRDGTVLHSDTVDTKEGRLVYDTGVQPELESVVLIYPQTDRLEMPDLWERLDRHRDSLLARLRGARFGVGLRGVVNPLGRTLSLPGRDLRGVPTSPAFQAELASILEKKHTTVEGTMAAWSLGSSALSAYTEGPNGKSVLKTRFIDLARLVPLWSGTRGVSSMWDPGSGHLFACDRDKSRAWEDIREAVAQAASRRARRLCAAIRSVVDVPVVQEWNGWAGITEDRTSAFDGMAARVSGETTSDWLDSGARAVSTVARWSTPGWLVVTDDAVPSKELEPSFDDLANLGLRAVFVDSPAATIAPLAARRAIAPPPDSPVDALFYPENATNPAAVQRLPGNRWWLPTPDDGNRLDLGDQFYGYRVVTPTGIRVVMWAKTPGRYLLRMKNPLGVTVTALDGTDPDPKKTKEGLTVTMGEMPATFDGLSEIPIPDVAVKETLDRFAALLLLTDGTRRVGTDERFSFRQAASALNDNPGANYGMMRAQLRRLASLLTNIAWIEAETSLDTTFSEVAPLPGASNDQALVLRALLPPPEGFTASYNVPVVNRDAVEMWVAARLSPQRRRELEASVGGGTLFATEAPISSYGAGFAWYHMGTTRLTGGMAKVELRMRSGVGSEAAIDAIVFAPSGWRPNGVRYPTGP